MNKYIKYLPFLLFAFTLLGNLQYPLIWNDEAECAMHSKRVLEYGYPKVSDGKNTVYPIRHTNKTLAIHKETGAYTGIGWAMFYYGTIGVVLADVSNDIYIKTLLLRLPFVLIGLAGIFIFYFTFAKLLLTQKERHIFSFLFFLFLLLYIDFALHLREMRYYALIIFFSSISIKLFIENVFYKYNITLKTIVFQTVTLWLLYNTFPPVFIIFSLFYVVVEVILWTKNKDFKKGVANLLPVLFSSLLLIPVILFFDTFNFSQETSSFYNFNFKVYLIHSRDSFLYFFKHGNLEWIFLLSLLIFPFYRKEKIIFRKTEYTLLGLILFAIIYFLVVNAIPHFVFTRYYLLLILISILILSLQVLVLYKQLKTQWFLVLLFVIFGGLILKNKGKIEGRVYELTHQYKGPLDYQIPYILDKYENTENLVIATNYEECSYMYYLNSKVTMGFVLNNEEEDLKIQPDIIIFRHDWAWNYEKEVFTPLFEMGKYERLAFPVYDYPYNNISEFNLTDNNHLFKTKIAEKGEIKAHLFIKKGL